MYSVSEAYDFHEIGDGLNGLCSDDKCLYAIFASGTVVKIDPILGKINSRDLSNLYNVEQPVSLSVYGSNLYVSDWHNHRILKLSMLFLYENSYGCFGGGSLWQRFRVLLSRHRIILSHSSDTLGSLPKISRYEKLHYFFKKILSSDRLRIFKPNGCFFTKDHVFLVSKNNKRIIFCDKNFQPLSIIEDDTLNRLGSVSQASLTPIFCDEQNYRVFTILDSGKLSFFKTKLRPFVAAKLASSHTCCVGGDGIEILDADMKSVFKSTKISDLHSLTVFNGRIFIAQRETCKIFEVKIA